MRILGACAISGTILVFSFLSANAAPITFTFDAEYVGATSSGDTSNLTDYSSGLVVGQIIQGSFSYDPSAAPTATVSNPSTNVAVYSTSFSFSIPSLTFSTTNGQTNVITRTTLFTAPDFLNIGTSFSVSAPPPNHAISDNFLVQLSASSGFFGSTALPTSINLADFNSAIFNITQNDFTTGNPSQLVGRLQLTFDITVLTQIQTPPSAALPLFATDLGGLGLLGWRRKRKAQT